MKKIIIGIVVIIILGLGYWLLSPFFIDKKVSEDFPFSESPEGMMETEPRRILAGEFEGFDSIHYGSGSASVYETPDGYVVRFEEDFNVANGPDLFVGFGKNGEYVKGSEIGRLKGNIGSQNYEVPAGVDISQYDEIWVWCRAFSVGFARAALSNQE